MLHDITNHVAHPFDVTTKNQYTYKLQPKTFGELCLQTAESISKMSDRPIAVFWSGGIDSTSALTAILQTVPLSRITVVCDHASIDEFPSFYEQKIKNRVKVISLNEFNKRYFEYFSVTGDGGDTVWGVVDNSFWTKNQYTLHLPWQDVIDRSTFDDIDFVEEFCTWSGVDIITWMDLRTWFYLCCKWQDKCARPYTFRGNLTDRDIVPFYDIDDSFQTWAVNNLDNIIGNTWQEYKIPAKQFIHQYHSDTDYLKNKSKVESMSVNYTLSSNYNSYLRLAIDQNYSEIRLPCWPFVDYADIEDFNDQYQLIPHSLLTGRSSSI
jgi:hypothetical protein